MTSVVDRELDLDDTERAPVGLFLKLTIHLAAFVAAVSLTDAAEPDRFVRGGLTILNLILPGPGHPRNSEGSFVPLKDGRILFAYSKFTSGGDDSDHAYIAARYSRDGGQTWTGDSTLLENEAGLNVMSVSLLRLSDGRIAFFYLRKDAPDRCVPYVRFSSDETRTWSSPHRVIAEDGYFVLNNDRVVQLRKGRLVLPVAIHTNKDHKLVSRGSVTAYLSDDAGRTWHRSEVVLECPAPSPEGLQEPGVVELNNGRVMMFIRTRLGRQYVSYSEDQGESWSAVEPSNILSPQSPALIKRIPKTGDLMLVWNDHSNVDPSLRAVDQPGPGQKVWWGTRTPLTVAISHDEGRHWEKAKNIEDNPAGRYAYPALFFNGEHVLLAYAAGGEGAGSLARTRIALFDLKWLLN